MHPEVSVHTAMWGGPWTSFWVTGWTSDGGTPVAREWPTPRRSPGNGGRRNAPSAWPPSQPLRRTSGTAVARRAGVRVPLTRYHRDGCKAVGACEGCSVGRPHCRRSRAIQTSPHCVQRREAKCSVKAAMAAAVAEHSGHRPTLRAGSAPGNWIMVSETVTQARPFWQSSGHKGGSNSRSTNRSPESARKRTDAGRGDLFLPGGKTKARRPRRVPISTVLQGVLAARRIDPAGSRSTARGGLQVDGCGSAARDHLL